MLGNPDSLAVNEVLLISVIGLAVVFLCLACLIIAIKIMSTIFQAMGVGNKKPAAKQPAKAAAAPAAKPAGLDEETYAVLLSTVSDATGLPLDKFRVVSVTEV